MKYKIEITGYGSEVAFGHIDMETKNRLVEAVENGNELSDLVLDSDFLSKGWFEVSDVYSNFNVNDDFSIMIEDEYGNLIFQSKSFDLQDYNEEIFDYEYFEEYLEENDITLNEDLLLMSVSGEKGTFFVGEIEDDEFSLDKLKIVLMSEIGTNNFFIDEMVSKVIYDGKIIESNDLSTNNKSFDSYINM